MIKCPTCATEWVEGTLYCENCGTYLAAAAEVDSSAAANPLAINLPSLTTNGAPTDTLRPSEGSGGGGGGGGGEKIGTLPLPAGGQGGISLPTRARRLRLLILNTGRLSNWLPDTEIQIGRSDRANGIFPQVDLDPDGGYEAGVSRKHAQISRNDDTYYVMDLGSVNGSFLNKQRLPPHTATALKDGDELRLGNVVMKVVMETVN